MPRVGSARMTMAGPVMSALPRTTFCWLPPERPAARALVGRLHAKRLEKMLVAHMLGRPVDFSGAGKLTEARERKVEADALLEHEAIAAAVLAREHEPAQWSRAGSRDYTVGRAATLRRSPAGPTRRKCA